MGLPRMRTIKHSADHFKKLDPETAICEYAIRKAITSGRFPCRMSGNRYLVDLDRLELFFANPPTEIPLVVEYGKLRQQAGR